MYRIKVLFGCSVLLVGIAILLISMIEALNRVRERDEACKPKCYPSAVSQALEDGSCICDLRRRVVR